MPSIITRLCKHNVHIPAPDYPREADCPTPGHYFEAVDRHDYLHGRRAGGAAETTPVSGPIPPFFPCCYHPAARAW